MSRLIDLTGQKFGRLTVISRAGTSKDKQALWNCVCECGNKCLVTGGHLRTGHSKSCGCYHEEIARTVNTKHGGYYSRLYKIYYGMRRRCYDVKNISYPNYGGRGIIVCDEWLNSFENFRDWALTNGYTDELTIDRINPNGNYESGNCRWISGSDQANNKRNNRFLTYNGETKSVARWEKDLGFNRGKINQRINRLGWSVEEALTAE